MTTLSDADISRELGKNILIYPFKEGNLKGASYNLTASKLAWSLSNKRSIYNKADNTIDIDPGDTALIETNETIWVSKKICGTYHSRVTQVSHGTGHIGTNLDPIYIGPSLIAVHNHSKNTYHIKVGKPFISLMFHYVHSDSTRPHGNSHGRKDVLAEIGINPGDELDQPYMSDDKLLLAKLEECQDYQKIKQKREQELANNKSEQENKAKTLFSKQWHRFLIGSIVGLLVLSFYLQMNQKKLNNQSWYLPTVTTINLILPILSSALTALLTIYFARKI